MNWLPDTLLCGCESNDKGFGDRAWALEFFALPLLSADLLESNCTIEGLVYYRITPKGTELAQGQALPTGRLWRLARKPADEYLQERKRYKETLEGVPNTSRDIGALPLPAAGWSEEFVAKYSAKMAILRGVKPAAPS